jgi:hypothetical protein
VTKRRKWFNSPAGVYEGSLSEVRARLPEFERRCFALTQSTQEQSRLNERLDMVVRRPFGDDPNFVPIGVVSKDYALVPHAAVLDAASAALSAAEIPSSDVTAQLIITEYGERMELSILLPKKYSFDPGDGHPMRLRFECLNSLDGSTRFRVLLSWLRLVCSNGLVIGVTRTDIKRRHVGDLDVHDVTDVLQSGLRAANAEKENLAAWRGYAITRKQLVAWIEKDLKNAWGFKAATRAFHIATTGSDAEIAGQYRDESPTTIAVTSGQNVPGAPPQVRNLFDISQVLAWLAKERRDVQEQIAWREQIPELIKPLLGSSKQAG